MADFHAYQRPHSKTWLCQELYIDNSNPLMLGFQYLFIGDSFDSATPVLHKSSLDSFVYI